MARITITDRTGTNSSIMVDKDDTTKALMQWLPHAAHSAEVEGAILDLQTALDRNQYTGDLEKFLGIAIS